MKRAYGWLLLSLFSAGVHAVDPTCDTSWSKTATTWTCTGNGKVSFASNSSFLPAANLTIVANNGFVLSGNTVGSATIRVGLQSDYGEFSISGGTLYGNLTASSARVSVTGASINGTITTGGDIVLSSSTVTGLVTSNSNTISATNSNLQSGLTSRSGITLTGGSVNGAITMTARNIVRLTGVTMPTGSISGASSVYLDNSDLGSTSAKVNVTTDSNDIYVQGGSVIYGDLSAAVNSNGTVQVQSGQVYGTCLPKSNPVNACNASPPPSVHHYELSYSSPGLTCEAEPVTIKACTDQACTALYSGATSVTLAATNSGSWSNASPTFNAGSASSTLRKTSTGASVISLSAASPTPSNAVVCKNAGATDSSCSISFADTGLKIFATDGVSAVPDLVAGVSYTVKLRAVQTNPTTGACQARVQGNRTVGVAFRCLDPTTCIAGQQISQGGFSIGGTAASSSPSYTDVPLTFDNNGTASVPFSYSDVGQIALHARLILAASGNEPGITLTAPAATPVVRPYEIRVTKVSTADGLVDSPATTSSGSGFLPAGTAFRVQLDVLNAAGNRTPNFGREISAEKLSVSFAALMYPPAPASPGIAPPEIGVLSNTDQFVAVSGSAGRFQNSQLAWSEAGSFRLNGRLADGNYLGAGNVTNVPQSVTIGRFYPQHFLLSSISADGICSGNGQPFSYLSQPGLPLRFVLQAVGMQNQLLQNYDSQLYTGTQANKGVAAIALVAENNGSPHQPGLQSRLAGLPLTQWARGEYSFNADVSTIQLNRLAAANQATSVDGPLLNLQFGVRVASEIDNRNLQASLLTMNASTAGACATCDAAKLGTEQKFYFGRLRLENVYGNAFQAAPVVLKAEVWNGSQFVPHSADSCSAVQPTALAATGTPVLSVSGTQGVLSGGVNPNNSLLLSAPGQNGSYSLQYQAPVWLKFNWNTGVAGDEHPTATALFGRYRGNDRLIYQREQ